MIQATGLAKRFGTIPAVADVTFTAAPGRVTGLVGPNGAGKSTTLRMLLGLVRPDAGTATFNGTPYRELQSPAEVVGAVLDIASAHPAATARGHLRTVAALAGQPRSRVDEVIAAAGLTSFADRRVKGFSTGMRQRLALATALLGRPGVLVLDEPSNGLDPAGIVWLRTFLRDFAAGGGTVLVSSHVLTDLEQSVDDLVLIDRGRTAWTGPLAEFTAHGATLEQAFLTLTSREVTA
jgi:ABC-2 type transport system ATP-binding protein